MRRPSIRTVRTLVALTRYLLAGVATICILAFVATVLQLVLQFAGGMFEPINAIVVGACWLVLMAILVVPVGALSLGAEALLRHRLANPIYLYVPAAALALLGVLACVAVWVWVAVLLPQDPTQGQGVLVHRSACEFGLCLVSCAGLFLTPTLTFWVALRLTERLLRAIVIRFPAAAPFLSDIWPL